MINNENNLKENNLEPWWKPAVAVFMDVSTWIIVPIILALVFGKILDNHFHTKPFIFLFLIIFSFLLSCYGIVKVIKNYMKKIELEIKKTQKNK